MIPVNPCHLLSTQLVLLFGNDSGPVKEDQVIVYCDSADLPQCLATDESSIEPLEAEAKVKARSKGCDTVDDRDTCIAATATDATNPPCSALFSFKVRPYDAFYAELPFHN